MSGIHGSLCGSELLTKKELENYIGYEDKTLKELIEEFDKEKKWTRKKKVIGYLIADHLGFSIKESIDKYVKKVFLELDKLEINFKKHRHKIFGAYTEKTAY